MTITQRRILEGSLAKRSSRPSLWRQVRIAWLEWERRNHDHIIARIDHERSVAIADRGMIDDRIRYLKGRV